MKNACFLPIIALSFILTALPSANAQLAITNGDFQNLPAGNAQTNVTDWFDYDGSGLAWWQQTSSDANPNISPFPGSSSYLFLSGAIDFNYWAYQSIGTNSEGLAALSIQYDAGTLVDAGGNINRTITISLYQSDGTFEGAQNVDINGAAGVTLVDSFDATTGPLAPGQTVTLSGELDLSSTDTTSELFLRVSNSRVDGGAHYTGIDNIIILDPERFSIVEHPVSVIVWPGEQVIFNMAVDSDLPYDVYWEISTDGGDSWTPIDGATSESYVVEAADISDDRNQYHAVAIQGDTTIVTDPAVLRVGDADVLTPQNVVAHYRFEGTDGGTVSSAIDSSGNGHDLGEPIGSPVYSSSVGSSRLPQTGVDNDTSLNLTGGDYAIQGTDGDSLSQVEWDDFTIEAWVNFASIADWQTIVGRDDRGNQNSDGEALVYFQKTAGNLFRFVGWGINGERLVVLSNFSFTPDTWTHLAAVADTESGTITLYADGNPVGSTGGYQGLLRADPNTHWTIGRGQFGGDAAQGDWVNGQIDEVRFSSAALSPVEFLNFHTAVINYAVHPQDVNAEVGDDVTFTALAGGGGTGPLTYQWQVWPLGGSDWENVAGATGASLTLNSVGLSDHLSQYRVVASRDGNSEPSNPALLSVPVYPPPNVIQDIDPAPFRFAGESFVYTVEATGVGNITYQWQRDGVDLEDETSNSLDLGVLAVEDEGTYSVVISDDGATADDLDPTTVTLNSILSVVSRPRGAISLNFVGAATGAAWNFDIGPIGPNDEAGLVPVANWNNSATVHGVANQTTGLPLVNDLGDATTATATWASANTWASRTPGGILIDKDADQRIYHGYIEGRGGSSVTVQDIPYSTYDVYVYPMGVEGAAGEFIRSVTLVNADSESTTLFGRNFTGFPAISPIPFILASASTLEEAEAIGPATVFRFTNVTGSTFTIDHLDVVGWNLGGIAGISIVNTTASVAVRPLLTSRLAGRFVPAGDDIQLSVTAQAMNGGSLSYQWEKDGANIGGATGATLTLSNATSADSGSYSVVVTETLTGNSSTNKSTVPVVVVDDNRRALLSVDVNVGNHQWMQGHGRLRTTGLEPFVYPVSEGDNPMAIGRGDTIWNRFWGRTGTFSYSDFVDSEGMPLTGVTLTVAGANGAADAPAGGGLESLAGTAPEFYSAPLLRDYVFANNANTMTITLGGLQAFAGRELDLVVYALGSQSTFDGSHTQDDIATVTLAEVNYYLALEPVVTETANQGREVRYNDEAIASFQARVAGNGTVTWTIGPVPEREGVNAMNGFQVLFSDQGEPIDPPESEIADWRQEYFGSPENSGPGANDAEFTGDGFKNLVKYALGADPTVAGSAHGLINVEQDGDFLTLTFSHIGDPNVVYSILATNDLREDFQVVHTFPPFNTVGEATYTEAIGSGASRFIRLGVSINE